MFSSNTSRVSADANYIEDVFSTWLYTGNGSTQTITNGIDLSTKGGMVWIKGRSGATAHCLYDTQRGAQQELNTNLSDAQVNATQGLTSFTSTGFSLGTRNSVNSSTATYASWTFRKQAKFFDVVTYTGNGVNGTAISHNLASVPGCMIIKAVSGGPAGGVGSWWVYHRSLTNPTENVLVLNGTSAASPQGITIFGVSATNFNVYFDMNTSGTTYVAYLFAHDAGGFGLTGNDNVISCGSFVNSGSDVSVSLGYEPQFVIAKNSTSAGGWLMFDSMRGMTVTGISDPFLTANTSSAEDTSAFDRLSPSATGFTFAGANFGTGTYIYIAIRRGPMRTPTSGTSVFSPVARTGNSPTVTSITSPGFAPDSVWEKRRSPDTAASNIFDKLRGRYFLSSATTSAETAANTSATRDLVSFDNLGFTVGEQWSSELNANTKPEVYWAFQRAPGFFDVVCYTGTGSNTTQAHNLGVVPELMIVKRRGSADSWIVYAAPLGATKYLQLETTSAAGTLSTLFNGAPTASIFNLGTRFETNGNASTYVNYLFATCPGVSKVGSYTGSGTTKQIDCGFTNGARFVLIKRTDSTGDWYVWDTARGIVSGNDPYLLLNSAAAEITNTDYIDTYSAGFELSSTAPAALNANGGSYIFLAIA